MRIDGSIISQIRHQRHTVRFPKTTPLPCRLVGQYQTNAPPSGETRFGSKAFWISFHHL